MPRRNSFELSQIPLQVAGRPLRMTKAYTSQDYHKKTVLTDDVFPYVGFYFTANKKVMKFTDATNTVKYGNPKQFGHEFYWNQAEIFYKVAKSLPVEAAPVAAYYCMLNAAKSFLAYSSVTADEFVDDFGSHGLFEDLSGDGKDLDSIGIAHKQKGVFPLFARRLDADFDTIWEKGKSNPKSLRCLLYNLPFVHRAYSMTYSSREKKVDELFIPLCSGESPQYYKGNDGKAYLVANLDKSFFAVNAQNIPAQYQTSISDNFKVIDSFKIMSVNGARYNSRSVSTEMKSLTQSLRKDFTYIRSTRRLWYIKRKKLANANVLNLSTMTLNMAAMHRISEIARYKPEQLNRLLQSKENWLLHEYISQALDQFLDEIAAEITKQDIMSPGYKNRI